MRRYTISLIAMTLVLVLASFGVMWFAPQAYFGFLPWLALYFGVVTGVMHWMMVKAVEKSPKTFVQTFLGSIVGMFLLHLVLIAIYLLTNHNTGRRFLIAFLVGFAVSFTFETINIVRHIDRERKRRQ